MKLGLSGWFFAVSSVCFISKVAGGEFGMAAFIAACYFVGRYALNQAQGGKSV